MKLKVLSVFSVSLIFIIGLAAPLQAGIFGNKFEKEVETEKVAIKLVREVQKGGYGIVSVGELKSMIDRKDSILVVDTMPYEASYTKAHIPGAVQFLFPVPEMDQWDKEKTAGKTKDDFMALLGPDKNRAIVIYCGFVKCGRSHNGALWARKLGYKKVYRCPGGIFAWKGAEYPVQSVNE